MPDMRDELVDPKGTLNPIQRALRLAVLDSIPPGSFKREDRTWVRLRRIPQRTRHTFEPTVVVYTEVDHAE